MVIQPLSTRLIKLNFCSENYNTVNLYFVEYYFYNLDTLQVVTYKNHALDNFMSGCVKKVSSPDVNIVRVGRVREDANEELKKCLLREVWVVGHN